MTPLQDFMAAAGFLAKHGDNHQTEVSIVSDNAKGQKVRTSSTVPPSRTPAQNIWRVRSKKPSSTSSTNRVCTCCWQPSDSFASDTMTEPGDWDSSSEFYEQESGSPRSPAGATTATMPVTDHRHPQELVVDHEKEEDQKDKMPSVVVKENNADHQEREQHSTPPPRPLVKMVISKALTYPVTPVKGHPGHLSPTKSPAAA